MNTSAAVTDDTLVSVVIPAYNAAATLERAVSSVVNCGADALAIVVDDGSTDTTHELALELKIKHSIDVLTQENTGLGGARSAGGKRVSSEFIAFLDADDECHPDRLRRQIEALRTINEPAIMFCGTLQLFPDLQQHKKCCSFSNKGYEEITEEYLRSKLLPSGASILMRTNDYLEIGGFRVDFRRQCELDLMSRAVANGARFFCIPEPLYIQHVTSTSNSRNDSGRVEAMENLIDLWEELLKEVRQPALAIRFRQFVRNRTMLQAVKSISRDRKVQKAIIQLALSTSWLTLKERVVLNLLLIMPHRILKFLFGAVRRIRWLSR